MINGKRIAVVMPAYNAEKTLEVTVDELPSLVDIRILVDDHSSDQTVDLGRRLGLFVFQHDRNYGYGRNQQTCYREALAAGADVVVMLHPDYQYTPRLITAMASMVAYDVYDVVLGSRIIGGRALHGGMPIYKYIANRLLTAFENLFLGVKLSEYHTGYRAFSRKVLNRTAASGKFRRLRLRQPDARPVRALRLPHRRSLLPHEVFRRSLLHQLPPQREIRFRRARVLLQDAGLSALYCAFGFMAQMLGTCRASVTEAAGVLKKAGLIYNTRGSVRIVNRTKLEDAACDCYAIVQRQLELWEAEI